jgi:ribosome-associated toxin RatA of RatAB toxin-antitoxin module
MPVIEVRRVLAAPLDKVVAIARNVEDYPRFMPDVRSVKVIESHDDGNLQKVEWVGIIKQFAREIRWVQEDRWVSPTRVEFHQIQGDYDKMEGYWEFAGDNGSTEFTNVLDYEYRVPLLGALVTKVVEFLVRQNLESIMDGIEKRATESVGNENP